MKKGTCKCTRNGMKLCFKGKSPKFVGKCNKTTKRSRKVKK